MIPAASLAPPDSDKYARLVQRAESGETDVDYRAMRRAYYDSAALGRARAKGVYDEIEKLRKQMREGMMNGPPEQVRDAARGILRFQYTDLEAQKALRQSCAALNDTGEVVSVDEEYFILRMMGFKLEQQIGPSPSEPCDTMVGTDAKGKPLTVYFNVEFVFKQYERMFKK